MQMTVLTLDEAPRLSWRKALTEYYRKTGDWSVYSLFPCILLSFDDHFASQIPIGNGLYEFSGKATWNGYLSILSVEAGVLPEFAVNAGLYISDKKVENTYDFPAIRTTAGGVALVEKDDTSFKILRFRRLRKDRGL